MSQPELETIERLRRLLAASEETAVVSHSHALEMVARLDGFKNWSTLAAQGPTEAHKKRARALRSFLIERPLAHPPTIAQLAELLEAMAKARDGMVVEAAVEQPDPQGMSILSQTDGDAVYYLDQAMEILNASWDDLKITHLCDDTAFESLLGLGKPYETEPHRPTPKTFSDWIQWFSSTPQISSALLVLHELSPKLDPHVLADLTDGLKAVSTTFAHLRPRLLADRCFVADRAIEVMPAQLHAEYMAVYRRASEIFRPFFEKHLATVLSFFQTELAEHEARAKTVGFDEYWRGLMASRKDWPPISLAAAATKDELRRYMDSVWPELARALFDNILTMTEERRKQGLRVPTTLYGEGFPHDSILATRAICERVSNAIKTTDTRLRFESQSNGARCIYLHPEVHAALSRVAQVELVQGKTDYGHLLVGDNDATWLDLSVKYHFPCVEGEIGWLNEQDNLNRFVLAVRRASSTGSG